MTPTIVGPEAEAHLDWIALTDAIVAGHRLPKAEIADTFLRRRADTLLTRSAWIDGLGLAVKAATIFPGNESLGLANVQGALGLFDDRTGALRAYLDFGLVTKWKTAADSLLAARLLARPQSRNFLIVGAGAVARSMVQAYAAAFPQARFHVWTRSPEKARAFAVETGAHPVEDLEAAVRAADVIATATMATQPIIRGAWLRPGTHLDLIGAYRSDMREVDDDAMRRARVFVDSRATTVHHIGEIMAPIASGALSEQDIVADFYDIAEGRFARISDDEITIAKNGGGAHLDLMTADYILRATAG
ncbi:ornithine cyclodeaminase [Albidovulum inexpectatum]|uniref:Ornithine cyclodeaminase n=1 Tax=Albidovulum inexpectatum TaxID=196587 RepID=A0A2S5JFZ8_9RHOB|nr:NAD(P)-binding domain-containing protein [Albidovulum inexpectatum]PPB80288.1 ornithine cyclodeaminase [Albidovulum inexpectatum]